MSKRPAAPALPESIDVPCEPLAVPGPHRWLILSDVHIPYHDRQALELAVAEGKRARVTGVLLNGDILDCHALSRWEKSPDDPRYPDEIQRGRDFLGWLRGQFPKARLLLKEGNHEERLFSYLCQKAPDLLGLDVLSWDSLLHLRAHGVDWVGDRRVIHMGKLNVLHGHEFRPQIQAPVNPARGLFLRAKSVALIGHHHQTSEHHEPTIEGKPQGAWSTGCLCGLKPRYMPHNRWNLGFAVVDVAKDGTFSVRNLRVLAGQVV